MDKMLSGATSATRWSIAQFLPPLTAQSARDTLVAGVGGFVAIGILGLFATAADMVLIVPPFGATCVLLFSVPQSPFSQPQNVIGGHVLSAGIGLVTMFVLGPTYAAMAIGVGLAIIAMRLTGTVHPPAGANPILVIIGHAAWWYFAVPVAVGSVALVAIAFAYHRLFSRQQYPKLG